MLAGLRLLAARNSMPELLEFLSKSPHTHVGVADRDGSLLHSWQPFSERGAGCLVDITFVDTRLLALSAAGHVQWLSACTLDCSCLYAQVRSC